VGLKLHLSIFVGEADEMLGQLPIFRAETGGHDIRLNIDQNPLDGARSPPGARSAVGAWTAALERCRGHSLVWTR
jgi:hypothetical protein